MSVAQAAVTLAATFVGFDIGLYGSDVVNAVMVVVAVSLIVTSIGANRFAPRIAPPVEERRRAGETILVPVLGDLDGLADVLRLGRNLAEPAGVREWMVGATYSEIIAATSVPVAIAALRPGTDRGRVVLFSAPGELIPGNRLTMALALALALALELASTLSRERGQELVIGPLAPSELQNAGLTIPEMAEHRPGAHDLGTWAIDATAPGDLVVVPLRDTSIGPAAISVHRSGRSVLACQPEPRDIGGVVDVGPHDAPVGRSLGG